jgi:hypothetical protein
MKGTNDLDPVESLLRRYKPIDPPADLRERVMIAAQRGRRARVGEWLPAAAALIVAVLFYWLAGNERRVMLVHLPPADEAGLAILPVPPDDFR